MEKSSQEIVNEIKKVWKSSRFDPNGAYTGNSKTDKEPIQDQDDL